MAHIYYNAWCQEYKKPFGAVKQGTVIDFRITVCDFPAAAVFLVIAKEGDGQGQRSYPMLLESKACYHVRYRTDQGSGLYFYYFEILCQQKRYYYGKAGLGGSGQLYGTVEALQAYQLTCYEKTAAAPRWYREAICYQIFPDRFCNGDPQQQIRQPKANSFIYGRQTDEPMYIKDGTGEVIRWDFYGGNLQGIIKKIPYLKELGVTALYLNPIFEASSNHRYDTNDYLAVDPVLGSEDDFEELLGQLHKNGIALILDGVFSHVGKNSRYFNQAGFYGEKSGASRNLASAFFPWFSFSDYPKKYKSWWDVKDLPEVDKTNVDFQQFIYGSPESVLHKWTAKGVDGWRLDVADELPDDFIRGIRSCLETYREKILLGEVWEDASNKIAYGQRRQYVLGDSLHGVMNYPLRQQILAVLQQERPQQTICEEMMVLRENYPRDFYDNLLNNLGTHDTERLFSLLGQSAAKMDQAWGLLFTMPGIPCIYYGDEAGLTGGKDPENRKFFPWSAIDPQLLACCQKWIRRRKNHQALQTGEVFPFYFEAQQLFGILRYNSSEYCCCVISLSQQTEQLCFAELASAAPFAGDAAVFCRLLEGQEILPGSSLFLVKEL